MKKIYIWAPKFGGPEPWAWKLLLWAGPDPSLKKKCQINFEKVLL